MSLDDIQSRDNAIVLSIELWKTFSHWFNQLPGAQTAADSKSHTAPNLTAAEVVQSTGRTFYEYLKADNEHSLSTRVQMLRSTMDLFGHNEWAAAVRKSLVAQNLEGNNFDALKGVSRNSKLPSKKKLFLRAVAQAAVDVSEQSQAGLDIVNGWKPAARKLKA